MKDKSMQTIRPSSIQEYITLISFIAILFFSIALQSTLFPSVDVSWLMEASRRMLAGGTYANDYFENNPPWILYFYAPVILFSKLLSINIILSARIYFYILACISLWVSYVIIKKIVLSKNDFTGTLLIALLAFVFLIFPLSDLGQREHLLLVLTTPYFLMMALRLQGKNLNPYLVIFVGTLAGSVFILKPYFLIPLFFAEVYYIIQKRNFFACVRLEIAPILFLLLIYTFIVLFRHPDYLTLVIPFSLRVCYVGSSRPIAVLATNPFVSICFLTFLLFIATYEINRYKQLTQMMLLATTGFLFSYFTQRVDYSYRIYPACSMAICLSALLFYFYATSLNTKNYVHIAMVFFIAIIIMYSLPSCYNSMVFNPVILYFSSFVLLVSMGSCLYVKTSIKKTGYYIFFGILIILFFYVPIYISYIHYRISQQLQPIYYSLVNYINEHAADSSIYFFSTNLSNSYPILYYTNNSTSASRFSGFWMLSGLIKNSYLNSDLIQNKQQISDEHFLMKMVTDDINKKKPQLIFVDTLENKPMLFYDQKIGLLSYKKKYITFDFLTYFKKHTEFNAIFKQYKYKTTIHEETQSRIYPSLYKLKLSYLQPPNNDTMQLNSIYLYVTKNGILKATLKDNLGNINEVDIAMGKNGMPKNQLQSIKENLFIPGAKLTPQNKEAIYFWLSKQRFTYTVYRFDIYEKL